MVYRKIIDVFKAPWWIHLGVLFLVLGTFLEVYRGLEKQRQAEFITTRHKTLLHPQLTEEALYHPVAWYGKWLNDQTFLLDNVTFEGKAGYLVYTPIETEEHLQILVERGWVPKKTTIDNATDGMIIGRLEPLFKSWQLNQKGWISDTQPWVIQNLDTHRLQNTLNLHFPKMMIKLNSDQPNSFAYHPRQAKLGPLRHYFYAIQFLLMAVFLVAIGIKIGDLDD